MCTLWERGLPAKGPDDLPQQVGNCTSGVSSAFLNISPSPAGMAVVSALTFAGGVLLSDVPFDSFTRITMLAFIFYAVLIGIGATALLDIWAQLLKTLFNLPTPPWHLVGRWFAGMPKGTFVHPQGIGASAQVPNELRIGWIMHYVVGILFAAAVLLIWGVHWAHTPTFAPALIVGLITVGAGWFILQPGMGVGVACSKAPNPSLARALNVIGHVVFAVGLYGTAQLVG